MGTARIVQLPEQDTFKKGDILVANSTDARYVPLIALAGALVIQEAGLTSHAAIAALEYGIPAIIGLPEAMATISEGQRITVDALAGVIYEGTVSIL